MPDGEPTLSRRDFLAVASSVAGACGMGLAAWPFIRALSPSADIAAGGVITAPVGDMKEGDLRVILWRGQPVFVLRRTRRMIEKAASIDPGGLSDPATAADRTRDPSWLVCFAICTHLGCIPRLETEAIPGTDQPGFFCPCHGGTYDSLGRRLDGPPPENLHLIPWSIDPAGVLRLGTASFAGFGADVRTVRDLPEA